jgi:HSP20 family protein
MYRHFPFDFRLLTFHDGPHVAHFSFLPPSEADELSDDIRELFEDLNRTLGSDPAAYPGQCRPLIDVFETDVAVELVVDTCGVPAAALRILFRDGVLIVAGEKAPAATAPDAVFHLVERDFGRFARAVRLSGAFDIGRAQATLRAGELSVVLPKLLERRGRAHRVAVTTPDSPAA